MHGAHLSIFLKRRAIMATQEGPLQFSGRIGNLLGTNGDNHRRFVGMHRFISKERIMKGKEFVNTRKNMSEFGASAQVLSGVMKCLGDDGKSFGGKRYRAEMQRKMHKAIVRGPGLLGRRTYESVATGDLLEKLELNPADQVSQRFTADYTIAVNADRNEAVLTVPAFVADNKVAAPGGATHFVVRLCAGVQSDIAYYATGGYKPVNATLHGKVNVQESAFLPVSGLTTAFTLTATIPGSPVLPTTAGLLVGLGIVFYKEVNTVQNLLHQANALRIEAVF
jgi:hypothetical protein